MAHNRQNQSSSNSFGHFADFSPKMAIFWRAGMREGGLPLPLAIKYLILIWDAHFSAISCNEIMDL